MNKPFNNLKEHLLIPLLFVSGMPLLLCLAYLGHEYMTVYTDSETIKFYLFNDTKSEEKYPDSTMFGILTCFLLLILSALSVRLKKSWILLLLSLVNFFQLAYLLLFSPPSF